jgi:hypothetical protein
MPRRRKKNPDFFEIALGIFGLVALSTIHPQTRAAFQGFASLAVLVIVGVVVVFAVIAVCRILRSAANNHHATATQITPEPTQCRLPHAASIGNRNPSE